MPIFSSYQLAATQCQPNKHLPQKIRLPLSGYNSVPPSRTRIIVPASRSLLSLPTLPKPGARIDLPLLAGSADALALAELAGRNKGHTLAVVTASAADAQRLLDEIPWFSPGLKVRLLPD